MVCLLSPTVPLKGLVYLDILWEAEKICRRQLAWPVIVFWEGVCTWGKMKYLICSSRTLVKEVGFVDSCREHGIVQLNTWTLYEDKSFILSNTATTKIPIMNSSVWFHTMLCNLKCIFWWATCRCCAVHCGYKHDALHVYFCENCSDCFLTGL